MTTPTTPPAAADPTPNPIIAPGNTAVFVPKNPLTSTAVWGLIVMVIAWAVQRFVPKSFQDQATAAAIEVATFIVGLAIALYGRWTAHRPLGVAPTVTALVK